MLPLLMMLAAPADVPVPPPIHAVSDYPRATRATPLPPVQFEVEVRSGNDILWSGPMRVAESLPANFNRQKLDAPDVACPPYAGRNGQRSSLSVSLSTSGRAVPDQRFALRVTWERPSLGAERSCEPQQGTRTVGLNQSFDLAPGQSTTITGDGGFSITIRRR